MTAPEDRRDEERFERTLDEQEQPDEAYRREGEDVPDAMPAEDLAAGPPEGR